MGNEFSSPETFPTNDFELVIRLSKELEFILEKYFSSHGKGLHEKISNGKNIPEKLQKKMRYVATIRNKLIHDRDFNKIDREAFINVFKEAKSELENLKILNENKTDSYCQIM
jgi:hypothetical protein